MPAPTPSSVPAVVWADRVTAARRHEHAAMSYARHLTDRPLPANDPYFRDLRAARYRAACHEADAWNRYAEECERAFQSAATAEMAAADAVDPYAAKHDAEQPDEPHSCPWCATQETAPAIRHTRRPR